MSLLETILKSPLFIFTLSFLTGYLLLYNISVVVICMHSTGRFEAKVSERFINSQNKQIQFEKENLNLEKTLIEEDPQENVYEIKTTVSTTSTKTTQTSSTHATIEHDNIKSKTAWQHKPYITQENQHQHPHRNLNSILKIACFIYPNKIKSAEVSSKTWLPLCHGGKILNSTEFNRDKQKRDLKKTDKLSRFKFLLGSYVSKGKDSFDGESTLSSITYDYFLFTESSSYILVSNLLEYLKNEDASTAKVYGHTIHKNSTDPLLSWSVEGTLVMNRKAVQKLLESQEEDTVDTYISQKTVCQFGRYIPNILELLRCGLEMGVSLIDSTDHLSKTTFFHKVNPFVLLSGILPKIPRYKNISSPYCKDKSCMSAFPIALHELYFSELKTIHFFVTWCRYALFLGQIDDPIVSKDGLTFNGKKLPTTKRKEETHYETLIQD